MKYLLGMILGLSLNAQAEIVYSWSGTCTEGCTGQANAKFYLFDDYVPGTSIQNGAFTHVETFVYNDSTAQYGPIHDPGSFEGFGVLPLTPDISEFFFSFGGFTNQHLFEHADGTWESWAEGDSGIPQRFHGIASRGVNGIFTPGAVIPEPGILSLTIASLLLMGLFYKRLANRL